jgi:hypothetical protein
VDRADWLSHHSSSPNHRILANVLRTTNHERQIILNISIWFSYVLENRERVFPTFENNKKGHHVSQALSHSITHSTMACSNELAINLARLSNAAKCFHINHLTQSSQNPMM